MIKNIKKSLTLKAIESVDTAQLLNLSEHKAISAFSRAAAGIPAYKEFLESLKIKPERVRTIQDFKNLVPLIDKQKTFKLYSLDIKKLCLSGEVKDVKMIVSSSGHSGCFSYGLNTKKEIEKSQEAIDLLLDYIFEVSKKKTLLINCLPMGVKIHSELVTVVDTSVRADIAVGIVKTFSACYEQIILVGENSFIKKVLEDGKEAGHNWKSSAVHIILGEEILPENLRTYMAEILGVNPDEADCPALIGSSFGVAEFGLNVFNETKDLIRIRRLLSRDQNLKGELIGKDPMNLPAILQYNPLRVYAEEVPNERGLCDIVLTSLEEDANIHLIRYNIKDEGMLIPFDHLQKTLKLLGYEEYIPKTRLPLIAIWGRDTLTLSDGTSVRPEFIKELLYADRHITTGITGYFRLSEAKSGLRIEIQAKENLCPCQEYEQRVRETLTKNLPNTKIEIIIYPYRDFPFGMELNYEKKFQYI